jgi:membrane-associated phospholipid phosphatase
VIVCASRVFFGLHYPSDVVAGAVLGTLTCWAVAVTLGAQGWLPALMPAG